VDEMHVDGYRRRKIKVTRVVSSDISAENFPCPELILIFLEIYGNLLLNFSLYTFNYNHMFPSPALQCDAVK